MILKFELSDQRDNWKKLGNMSKDDAMKKYIAKAVEITKKIPSKESEAFRKELEG